MVEAIDSAEKMSDAIDVPLTIKLGGQEFKLSPLSAYDLAEAERFYIADNLNNFLEHTQLVKGVILPDSVRGMAIAEIMNRTVGFDDILVTKRGAVHLLYLSLKKLTPTLTMETMPRVDQIKLKILDRIIVHISGMGLIKEVDGKDPLETQTKTSTPEDSAPTSATGAATFTG